VEEKKLTKRQIAEQERIESIRISSLIYELIRHGIILLISTVQNAA